jgi:MFS family permease
LLSRFRHVRQEYPRQFWLLFWGMLISTIGASMIWPFLMIYVSETLSLSLTAVASLMTLSSIMGLIASFTAGPIVDRMGRKWVMAISLLLNGLGYLLMSQAHTFPAFAAIMALNGAVNPLYRVSADAMMADLIGPEKRADGYSLLRMSNNVGVALGPSIGGFVASVSYSIAFYCAAAGLATYGVLITLFARETLPSIAKEMALEKREKFGGYGQILRDTRYMAFIVNFILIQMCSVLIWVLLGVYAKQHFNVSESRYGFIPTTNALMVVFLQYLVTTMTKRHPPLKVLAVGGAIYAAAVTSIAFGTGFWSFWLTMVVLTVGELILMPTSSTYAANSAPADKRGRYMSLYGLTWPIAQGIGPFLGGVMSDNLGPRSPWFGGGLSGLIGVIGFLIIAQQYKNQPAIPEASGSMLGD